MSTYIGIGPESGKAVSAHEAYEYAKAHLDEMSENDKAEFVSFFFSGNWIEEE